MSVWSQEAPYDDVSESGMSRTPRERLYEQRFFGDEMRAPTRTLQGTDDVNLDLANQVNSRVSGRK